MKKIGMILIVWGVLSFCGALIFAINNEWQNPSFFSIITALCFVAFGGILYYFGRKAKQKAQANNTNHHEITWGKVIFYVIVVMFVISAIGRYATSMKERKRNNTVAGQVEKANQLCPIDLGGVGTITSISIAGKQVVYHVEYDNTLISLDMVKLSADAIKRVFFLSSFIQNAQGHNNGDRLMQMLIEQGYGLTMYISSNKDNFYISISPQELAAYEKQDRLNPTEAVKDLINMQVEMAHETLPQTIDTGLICTNISIEDNNVIYRVEADEKQYNISAFEDNKESAKEELYMAWKSEPTMRNMLSLCKVAHTGIVYRFVGNVSQDSCDIVIDADYISNNTATQPRLNIR